MNLAYVDEIYALANSLDIKLYPIANQQLKSYTKALSALEWQLSDLKDDSFWRPKIRMLKRYRFRLHSLPTTFDEIDARYALETQELYEAVEHCANLYPGYEDIFRITVEKAILLTSFQGNPMLEKIRSLKPGKDSAILIKEARFIDDLERVLRRDLDLRHLEVVNASQLRYAKTFSEIFLIGALRWFPEYVVTATRSPRLNIIYYDFLSDNWEPSIHFLSENRKSYNFEKIEKENSARLETYRVEADEILPTIDWGEVIEEYKKPIDDDDEFVDANLFLLEDSSAIFLDKKTKELAIDSDFNLRRISVSELEPEMFLIAREKGSGDYIVPFANKYLGDNADVLRQKQKRWKLGLRKAVMTYGIQRVKEKLRLYGALSANEINIRNWMSLSERKIRPKDFGDFKAIMIFLDLAEYTKQYWESAGIIRKAHQQAGKEVTRLLKIEVDNAAKDLLRQRGYQCFKLRDYTTSFHAYRIIEIKPDKIRIPAAKTAEIIDL